MWIDILKFGREMPTIIDNSEMIGRYSMNGELYELRLFVFVYFLPLRRICAIMSAPRLRGFFYGRIPAKYANLARHSFLAGMEYHDIHAVGADHALFRQAAEHTAGHFP